MRGKRILLLTGLASGAVLAAAAAWIVVAIAALPGVSFLADPGASFEITVRGWDGGSVPFKVGPENPKWTPIGRVSPALRDAVVASEDFSFFSHRGVDWFEVREAIRRDLAERRFVRGASTITQQLAKNLFLSREKTLLRKLRELVLARRIEKTLTKERILELYVNVVELGPLVYGVGAGARYHFGKAPADLTLRESAFLAAMLPGPRIYDPYRTLDRVMTRADHVLAVMLKGRMITEEEYRSALGQMPTLPRATPPAEPVLKEPAASAPIGELEPLPAGASGEAANDTAQAVEDSVTEPLRPPGHADAEGAPASSPTDPQ